MPDDKTNRGGQDRMRASAEERYPVYYLMQAGA